MRIPRRHRFRTDDSPAALFRRLPPGRRFRLAPGHASSTVFGSDPARVLTTVDARSGTPLLAGELRAALPRVPPVRSAEGFPGGAVGFVSYERGYAVEELTLPRFGEPTLPPAELCFGVYDTFVIASPGEGVVEVVSWGLTEDGAFDERRALERAAALEERLRSGDPGEPPGSSARALAYRSSLSREEHAARVREILAAIARGDLYQANLTARFDVEVEGEPLDLFERLLRENPAPHAGYLETDLGTVISCSPERLLAVRERAVESRPIKGTAARDPDPALDRVLAETLARSEKDRAELLMITDLLRNDLGKVCEYGTVRVPELRRVESFAHVHHLVSTIRGRLRAGRDTFDALEAVFPCGSITGAPKRRAMELLAELETAPRGVYTGTFGWIGFDRSADLNVAIRSGMMRDGVLSFGAGGGIVADSDPDAEWDELLLKARAFAQALGIDLGTPVENETR